MLGFKNGFLSCLDHWGSFRVHFKRLPGSGALSHLKFGSKQAPYVCLVNIFDWKLDKLLAMYVSIIRYQAGKVDAVKVRAPKQIWVSF